MRLQVEEKGMCVGKDEEWFGFLKNVRNSRSTNEAAEIINGSVTYKLRQKSFSTFIQRCNDVGPFQRQMSEIANCRL